MPQFPRIFHTLGNISILCQPTPRFQTFPCLLPVNPCSAHFQMPVPPRALLLHFTRSRAGRIWTMLLPGGFCTRTPYPQEPRPPFCFLTVLGSPDHRAQCPHCSRATKLGQSGPPCSRPLKDSRLLLPWAKSLTRSRVHALNLYGMSFLHQLPDGVPASAYIPPMGQSSLPLCCLIHGQRLHLLAQNFSPCLGPRDERWEF